MTTQSQTEALKLALEALEELEEQLPFDWAFDELKSLVGKDDYRKALKKARGLIPKIKEALAQQSPQRSEDTKERSDWNEQVEPVAFVGKSQFERLKNCGLVTTSLTTHKAFEDDVSLYTHPPVPNAPTELTAQPKAVAPQHKQEPKCIGKAWAMWGGPVVFDPPLVQPEQRSVSEHLEPVGIYRNKCADGSRCLHGCHTNESCYTALPQRKPLTNKAIQDALEAEFLGSDAKRNWQDDLRIVRAIEAAHGIKG